jgi:preprotein translocase subunit SecF
MKLLKLVPDNTNIKFLRWRVPFYVISLLLMAASITLVFTKGLNLGVDFVGGQMIRVTFVETAAAPVAELREKVGSLGYGEPIIQQFGKPNEVSIRMKLPEGSDAMPACRQDGAQITAKIKSTHADARIDGVDSVSGKVSGELFSTGMQALLAGDGGDLDLYLGALRMAVRGGRAVRAAPRRDADHGLFALTQMEFDLNIVAALLTLIGYSLNDTIVVYDRIRENMKKFRRMPMPELLDLSVNETLSAARSSPRCRC